MMFKKFFSLAFALFFCFSLVAQSPIGIWKNLDDEDGKPKSHIEIWEKEGKLYGTVIKLLPSATITVCDKCKGDKKGKNIVGMEIMWDLEKKEKNWDKGRILDPKSGKEYKCKIELEDENTLKVRGYKGISAFGRTQKWYRVVEEAE